MKTAAAIVGFAGLLAGSAAGARQTLQWSEPPKGYVAYRASAAPAIDGRLDDAVWKLAPWTDAFVDIEGAKRQSPRHETRVRMLWDDANFYIGAELVEPHLWATLTEHDSVIFRDNDFELFIDPNGDNHEYYELEINALGTTWDLLLPKPYKDDGKAVNGWEIAGLRSAVHLNGTLNDPRDTDRGWSVELALPWKALGELARRPTPPRDGDQWRVNFSRVQWDLDVVNGKYVKRPKIPEHNWVWSPQGVIDMHRPDRWGYVQFATVPGTAFQPDSAQAVKDLLHGIYYEQKEFRKKNSRWAATFEDLGMATALRPFGQFSPTMSVARDQFQVTAVRALGDGAGTVERWHIRQDSMIWKD